MNHLPLDQALTEGRVPDRSPEGIPELHEVNCPPELQRQIETLICRYPDRHSASIPALWAVQRLYGWCTPQGIREAAAVMRVTPAYLESVASFYDLLHTEPVATHRIAVCTNISCWMRGGDQLLEAFRTAAEGEDVFVTGFECLGACDIAPMASIQERYYGPLEQRRRRDRDRTAARRGRGPARSGAGQAGAAGRPRCLRPDSC